MSDETLFALIGKWQRQQPDRPALIDAGSGRIVRYGELADAIATRARAFENLGIGPGSRCVVIMERSVALIETVLALSRLGAECLPLDCASPRLASLNDSRVVLSPRFVIHDRARRNCADWRRDDETWIDISRLPLTFPLSLAAVEPSGNTPLYLNSTSGSTGVSKMVIATHGQTLANARACEEAFGFESGGVHLCTFRVHVHDLFVRAIVTGGTAVLVPAEGPVAVMDAIVRFNVNYLMINPLVLAGLMAVLDRRRSWSHLRLVECGGGPLSGVVQRVVGHTTGARVISVWGSTETAGVAIAPPPGWTTRGHALGVPLAGYQLAIVDSTGAPVPSGVEGEMVICGEAVAEGYLGTAQGSPQLRANCFRTGDLVRRHSDGWIELRGRASNSFKVAGSWVNAERIEAAIREDPTVSDVVVFPQAHRTFGCVPVALVVMKPGAPSEPDRSPLADRLEDPTLEMPERFITVVDLPRIGGGKIDRGESKLLIPPLRRTRRRGLRLSRVLGMAWKATRRLRLRKQFFAHPLLSLRLLHLLGRERHL